MLYIRDSMDLIQHNLTSTVHTIIYSSIVLNKRNAEYRHNIRI